MSFASINQSLLVPNGQLKKIYNPSTTYRNNLVFKKEDIRHLSLKCVVCVIDALSMVMQNSSCQMLGE